MTDDEPTGRAKGGFARAANMTPEQRSAQAADAAKKRWADHNSSPSPLPKVLEGYSNIANLAGIKLPCAVIDGPHGVQRVLTETGITNAVLGSRSGASKRLKKAAEEAGPLLPIFVAPSQLKPFITREMLDGPLKPIDYIDGDRVVRGYDASILTTVCNLWLEAREKGALQKQQLAKAQQAEILTRALAETGIVALIDEATGYEKVRPQNALQAYLEMVVRKELAAWAKRFPDEFYENIYKLKGWPWPGMKKNRYSVVAHYTNDLVYSRLGPGILNELQRKTPKNDKGYRDDRMHQWLTENVGHPMLAQHLHSLMMFQRLAISNGYGWKRFMLMVDQVLPKRGANLELPLNDPSV
jgi:hypothetical protein